MSRNRYQHACILPVAFLGRLSLADHDKADPCPPSLAGSAVCDVSLSHRITVPSARPPQPTCSLPTPPAVRDQICTFPAPDSDYGHGARLLHTSV